RGHGHELREPGAVGRIRRPPPRRARAEGLRRPRGDRCGGGAAQACRPGHRSRADDRGAGRLRRLVAARDVIEDPQPTIAPYGSWRSQIRIDDVVGDVVRLGEPWIDGDDIYWVEQRPTEAGRHVLVRAAADG